MSRVKASAVSIFFYSAGTLADNKVMLFACTVLRKVIVFGQNRIVTIKLVFNSFTANRTCSLYGNSVGTRASVLIKLDLCILKRVICFLHHSFKNVNRFFSGKEFDLLICHLVAIGFFFLNSYNYFECTFLTLDTHAAFDNKLIAIKFEFLDP